MASHASIVSLVETIMNAKGCTKAQAEAFALGMLSVSTPTRVIEIMIETVKENYK